MACAAIMQPKWRCRVGAAPRVLAEKFDAAFDLGWSSASMLQQLHYFESGLAAEVAVYFPGMSFSARAVCQL